MALLDARNITLSYSTDRGVIRAVDGVSFSVERGETVGVIGETGSGKTSLVHALSRVYPRNVSDVGGTVLLRGRNITDMPEAEFRREIRSREIAIVFQAAMNGFNPVIRIGRQIAERAIADGQSEKQLRPEVETLLERVGLAASAYDRYPHELSGGMKQRAALAMALLLRPPVVILDEPTSALDVSVQAQIMNTLKQLKWDMELSMLFITHDIALASDLCDRLVVMYAGQVREEGSAEDVLTNPKDPYTRELLSSITRLRGSRPRFITGESPDPVAPPTGCRFHTRCPNVYERCSEEAPPLAPVNAAGDEGRPGQLARCWLNQNGGRV